MQQKDIMNVRRAVDANIGRRVRVRANKGRHKYSVAEGVIQEELSKHIYGKNSCG